MEIDLDYIYTICDSDREFIHDMLSTFVKITPGTIDEINDALEAKNWKEIARVAHKIKPSMLLLGVEELTDLIKEIESNAKQNPDADFLSTKISLLNQYSLEILTHINELLTSGNY